MNRMPNFIIAMLVISLITACNNITYIPKNKKKQLAATPSVLIFEKIAEFRLEQHGWPVSREDFMGKGKKYYDVMTNFEYQSTSFKIIDSNRMVFYFSNYKTDMQRYDKTKEVDLNSFNGSTKFWKENGKFLWKTKMN